MDHKIVLHQGVYKKTASLGEAVFLITGMTIGAGILGLPYVVSRVGVIIGVLMIVVLGLVMMLLNLMVGEIAVRTRQDFQLAGFAGKYLGKGVKNFMSLMLIFGFFGTLLAYVVGEGRALSAIFGGDPVYWSVFFWSIGSIFIWRGLQTIKKLEMILSMVVIAIITGLSIFIFGKFNVSNFFYTDLTKIFLPYGVIMFALSGSAAVAEAHAILPNDPKKYRKAVILGSAIPIFVYVLFALSVAAFSGLNTTEVATVGLGNSLGGWAVIAGNVFAILAMGTGFMGFGVALKQIFVWDYKVNKNLAEFTVIAVPIILFLFGIRSFVVVLDIVGGLFIGLEAIVLVAVAYMARKKGDIPTQSFGLKNFWLMAIPILFFFSLASVYTVMKMVY
jgi:tyrosine-specific transport protein